MFSKCLLILMTTASCFCPSFSPETLKKKLVLLLTCLLDTLTLKIGGKFHFCFCIHNLLYCGGNYRLEKTLNHYNTVVLAPVAQRVDSTIRRINYYPLGWAGFGSTYRLSHLYNSAQPLNTETCWLWRPCNCPLSSRCLGEAMQAICKDVAKKGLKEWFHAVPFVHFLTGASRPFSKDVLLFEEPKENDDSWWGAVGFETKILRERNFPENR